MFVRVDGSKEDKINSFEYLNQEGKVEKVQILSSQVRICDTTKGSVTIFYEDVPNLIKALEEAYKHMGSPT